MGIQFSVLSPEASGEFKYSLRDMDLEFKYSLWDMDSLVGEQQQIGIANINDLSYYHLHFVVITTWLMKKNQPQDLEQQWAYLQGFQPTLLASIMQRLQLKNPDHHPNIPYNIQEVYEAAWFILQGSSVIPIEQTVTSGNQGTLNYLTLKTEQISTIFSKFTKSIIDAINNGTIGKARVTQEVQDKLCNFCSGPHFIRECKMVEEYIKTGKCRRNIEGNIVLSTGAWILWDIPGNNFKEWINKWHNCNPNQLAGATLLNTIIRPTTVLALMPMVTIGKPVMTSYQLSATNHIAALEAKLFTLKALKPAFASAPCTRAQKARAAEMRDEEDKVAVTTAWNQNEPRIAEIMEHKDKTPTPAAKSIASHTEDEVQWRDIFRI